MKYNVTSWSIKTLYDTYKTGNLNLSPPYQRNFIWSINDQRYLIESIKKTNPIPNFFLLEKDNGKLEMVDGQQRSRTILSFLEHQFTDLDKAYFSVEKYPKFWDYLFPVTIITDTEGESIERFYAIVNKTGIHVNKPEIRKADYYDTVFLGLVNDLATSQKFKLLKVFSDSSLKRMSDTEFISELIVLLKKGHVDKKNHLDEYFENDITKDEAAEIKGTFNEVLDKINYLNNSYDLVKTRYKQRNDFYTLFDFVASNDSLQEKDLLKFYKLLVEIGSDIKPSQDDCIPLRDYAINCVTQSNSKSSRENRLAFFNELLLNKKKKVNPVQKAILKFYKLDEKDTITVDSYLTINFESLNKIKAIPFNDEI